jgi:DNA-directed RNA polymerase I, II, and III subunit RPABC1
MRELWLARNTIIEMMQDRGYSSSNTLLNYTSFIAQYPGVQSNPNLLNFIVSKEHSVAIHFTNEDKLAKKSLDALASSYSLQGVESVVLITFNKLNPACKALLKSIKMVFEHFLVEELQFNITKHCLVPRHRVMTENQLENLLSEMKCEKSNLPTILTVDPVCRYFGAKIGNVFEITRNSQTTGTAIYYRAVKSPGLK